jgi:Trypsin-like peptidase domain
MTADDLTAGIVGILQQDGSMAGTGFVVHEDGMLATCAHVVKLAGAGRGSAVHLVFHATKDEQEAKVVPEYWRDPKAEDIAILHLEGSLPEGIKSVVLGRSPQKDGHHFVTFGFPPVREKNGMWGYGTVGNLVSTGDAGLMLQLTTPDVTAGFSGAPILDDYTNRVVGMVSTITPSDMYERLQETAFVTPTETLKAVCSALSISPDEVKDDKPLWDPTAPPMDPRGVMGPLGPLGPLGSLGPGGWLPPSGDRE